jgi:glyoxylase-like metal-dependent hydrolase (beta-lactamase superfamily II)
LGPDQTFSAGPELTPWRLGQREFQWLELKGHTDSDLVLIDKTSGIAFVGGLIFSRRVPTTPHARISDWLASLDRLEALGLHTVVPSHGPVFSDGSGLAQTRRYLIWLDGHFQRAARLGWDMNELLRAPVPEEFGAWAAFKTEYVRNIAHLYPGYERAALTPSRNVRP